MDEVDVTMSHMNTEINVALRARKAQLENDMEASKELPPCRECIDCGREIPAKRLKAVPWAKRCVQCQEAAEEKR